MRKFASDTLRAFLGLRHTWSYKSVAQSASVDIGGRLKDAFSWVHDDALTYSDDPVFIFSAGWRAGSTLLQRMIMKNNNEIVIWGEPFHLSNIFDNMVNQFRCFTERYPREEYFLSRRKGRGLSDQWVANLYPDVEDLVNAHRRFFQVLFSDPASKLGAKRWGVKVVRLSIDHAIYLRRMFPQCKIIFTCRDPLDAYASFRKVHDAFFLRWPDKLVATPYAFGRHWADLMDGFLKNRSDVNGLLIRYEDLDEPDQVSRLEAYLGWPIPCASSMERIAGDKMVGGIAGGNKINLPILDRALLGMAVGTVRKCAGY